MEKQITIKQLGEIATQGSNGRITREMLQGFLQWPQTALSAIRLTPPTRVFVHLDSHNSIYDILRHQDVIETLKDPFISDLATSLSGSFNSYVCQLSFDSCQPIEAFETIMHLFGGQHSNVAEMLKFARDNQQLVMPPLLALGSQVKNRTPVLQKFSFDKKLSFQTTDIPTSLHANVSLLLSFPVNSK